MIKLSSSSLSATFSTLGARLVSLTYDGVDVTMGGGTELDLLRGDWTAGAICGRVAGRIAQSQFQIDGVTHKVLPTFDVHQLHGGPDNFAIRHWDVVQKDDAIRFALNSPDGDQGFSGAIDVTATYAVKGNVLSLVLQARTTKPTVINLTNHAYWNLIGSKSAFEHEMQIEADQFIPMDETLLVTGETREVANSRYDFRRLRLVGENYDNCWALTGKRGQLRKGLTLRDPGSGRRMEVWTTESAMQMYTAAHWHTGFACKRGPLHQYEAIAIEPQNFAGAPNHANFPSAVLRPGEIYRNKIEWRFG